MEQVFCDVLENLPEGKPLEKPITTKKIRVLPDKVERNPDSEVLWSSLDAMESSNPSTSSGHVTPKKTKSVSNKTNTLSPDVGERSAKRRRILVSPAADKLANILNYGSEEESEEEEEGSTLMLLVPRVARMYFEEDNEEVEEGDGRIDFNWTLPSEQRTLASKPGVPTPVTSTPDKNTPGPIATSPEPASPSTTPMEPSNKFKFDWRRIKMPQVDPRLRREPFSQSTGPTVSFANPYKAFTAIWDREIIELIVKETNNYAQQLAAAMLDNNMIKPNSRITRWQDTNVNEIYTYLAIVMAMGLVVKSRMEEYWNASKDIFITPGFTMEMSCDRFMLLSKCLHFNNNNDCNPTLLSRHEAKIYKIKPIIDHLNKKFSSLYTLSQNIALDESLTMWKGWLDINQFISNKAATIGIKTYEICESQTGYLWRFEVHTGHDDTPHQHGDPLSGRIPTLVLRLLNGLEHKGHTVWMDNFYNSPTLARELKTLGFDCVGTLRTNRLFVPSKLATVSKSDMTVGQVLGCTSGDVDLMVWRDKNLVAFVSTYHGLEVTKCGDTLKPTVVHDYNLCMGGVDRKDQLLAMYPIERRRTRVWYKKFFRRLLNTSVLNSYILLNNRLMTHRQFRKSLITDLLTAHRPYALPTPTIRLVVHSPAQYDLIKPGKPDRLKRKCVVCTKRTITYCKACNVAMCTFTCYEPYHTSH